MKHERQNGQDRPPLRKFIVRTVMASNSPNEMSAWEDHKLEAHLVFDNTARGEGLIFRRYYDDNVKTEVVALFQPGMWLWFMEISNG